MNELNVIKALGVIYNDDTTLDEIMSDWDHDYLTISTARNKRDVLWLLTDSREVCVYLDTCETLDDDEIKRELL